MTACASKRRHTTVKTALRHRESLGDPYVSIYWCEPCEALHLGHLAWTRNYATWGAAMQAVSSVQAQQREPRRMRVWKQGGRWWATWAESARAPYRPPADAGPLVQSMAAAFARAHGVRA